MPVTPARVALFSLLTTLAAQARPLPHPLEPTPEWLGAVDAGTRTRDGRPGPSAWTSFAHYTIAAELDPDAARVHGTVEMTFHNRSPHELGSLGIHLRQNLHAPDAVRNLHVEVTGGFELGAWTLDGKPANTAQRGTVLELFLPEPLAPGGKTTAAVEFAFTVPDGEAPRMGRDGSALFFLGYWYPQFAVVDDVRGLVAEPYLGESEFYMDWADYDVALTVPKGWLVQATGTLQNAADVLPEAIRKGLADAATGDAIVHVVTQKQLDNAAVATADAAPTRTWRFRAERVRDFAWTTSPEFLWDATSAEVSDRDGDGKPDRTLVSVLYRKQAAAWRQACKQAQHTIRTMSRWLVPYPYPHATAVEGILGGGMEYPMLVLCGDQRTPFANQSLIAHELTHMWFPMLVGNDETAFGWQDEGLTDWFTARLENDFWQQQRPSAAQRDYRSVVEAGGDREPMLTHADHLRWPQSYVYLCYTKPAAVLQQLAGLVGEDKLVAALQDYARTWSFAHPTPEDFFAAMDRSLGQDLGWYWSTWWTETWTLDHAIDAVRPTADGSGTEVVVVDRGKAPHPATVQVTFADGRTAEQTVPVTKWLAGERSVVLTFPGTITAARLDPRQTTLDVERGNDTWEAK
jgi:hypothetical protein